ncbi:MAG: L-lactate dehydrogenase [Christensenellales bacterium]
MVKRKKITILGAGKVGASIAFGFVMDGTASEIVMVDIDRDKAEGEVIDLTQSAVFCPAVKIVNGTYEDAVNSDIVVITLGVARKPGQTRLDLANINVGIIKQVIPQIVKYASTAMYVVVSNPVDILTYAIHKYSGLPSHQIIGSGTLLDTIRLSSAIADYAKISSRNVHSYVFGEHGDSSMVPWSLVTIGGAPIKQYCKDIFQKSEEETNADLEKLQEEIRASGAKIIKLKGATYYGIALTVRKICDAIMRNSDSIMPLSTMLNGEYGISGVCMSVPCLLGGSGISKVLPLSVTPEEQEKLVASADALKSIIKQLDM